MSSGKTDLNEYIQKRRLPQIVYTTETKGSEHNKDFKSIVVVNNKRIESEWKKNKKDAEKDCASYVLEYLRSIEGSPVEFSTPETQTHFEDVPAPPPPINNYNMSPKRPLDTTSSPTKRTTPNPFSRQLDFMKETPLLSIMRDNDIIPPMDSSPQLEPITHPTSSPISYDKSKKQEQQLQIQKQQEELEKLREVVDELTDKINRVQYVFQDQILKLQENNTHLERDLYNLKQFVETCSMPASFVEYFVNNSSKQNQNQSLPKHTNQPLPNSSSSVHLIKDEKLLKLLTNQDINNSNGDNNQDNNNQNDNSQSLNINNLDIQNSDENSNSDSNSDSGDNDNNNEENGNQIEKKKKKTKKSKPKRVFLHRHQDYQKIELDFININEDDPDNNTIGLFVYNIQISHNLNTNEFRHKNKSYLFSNFLLYTTSVLDFKPAVHIVNQHGHHFAIGLTKGHQENMSVHNFRKIVTFHNFFFSQILGQNYLNFHDLDRYFTVPNVKCLSEPTKPIYDVLMDLLEFDHFPTEEFVNNSVYDESFKQKCKEFYLNKVLITRYGDLSICREIDFLNLVVNTSCKNNITTTATTTTTTTSEYNNQLPEFKIQDSKTLINVADESNSIESIFYLPVLLCSHVSAKISEDFWKLKCILYFDKDGQLEDPKHWNEYNKTHKVEPINFASYFKKHKYFQKNPLDIRTMGIPSFIHSIGKLAILPFYSEINWCVRLSQFNHRVISLKSYKILREAFTHPSTKAINRTPPLKLDIFKNYTPYLGDNQRLEFLGDSVLKLSASIYLFYKYPNAKEGQLSMERANNIKNENLIEVSKRMHLEEILRLSNTDEIKKPHADVIEALFGAICLDRGFEKAYEIIVRYVFNDPNVRLPIYQSTMEETILSHDLRKLLFNLNLRIDHPSLLEEAFAIGSIDRNYQRLEFVGDAVLDYITADYLYKEFDDINEGMLTEFRSRLVRNKNLSLISKKLELPPNIPSEERNNLTEKKLGDYFESLMGCLVLDRGIDETKEFVKIHLDLNRDNRLFIINNQDDQNNQNNQTSILIV